jgi:hypothetical protein
MINRIRDRLARYRRYASQIKTAGKAPSLPPELRVIKERIWRKVLAHVNQRPSGFRARPVPRHEMILRAQQDTPNRNGGYPGYRRGTWRKNLS